MVGKKDSGIITNLSQLIENKKYISSNIVTVGKKKKKNKCI